MPELPEVETLRRELHGITSATIRDVDVSDPMLLGGELSEDQLRNELIDETIVKLDRLGKYCLVQTKRNLLLFSLRMTGNLRVLNGSTLESDRYVRFNFNDRALWFTSVRRFSKVHLYGSKDPDSIKKLRRLGPDPLKTPLTATELENRFKNRTAPVKTALMNQEILAGLGNIYANEICYDARLNPKMSVAKLSADDLDELATSIPELLNKAIELGGSSIRDYQHADGSSGEFQENFYVYGRENQDCFRCSTSIRKTVLAGRGTFWCPECQS